MLIITIRTDKPEAELGLFEDDQQLAYEIWPAHRQLAETIHLKLTEILSAHAKKLQDIQAIVTFKGPGSFTGLRIGITVANTLADSLKVPLVATDGAHWQANGINRLLKGENEQVALPEYGALPNVTKPKK